MRLPCTGTNDALSISETGYCSMAVTMLYTILNLVNNRMSAKTN